MNDDELLFQAYRKLNVPLFLGAIGRTPHNILAIGKQQNFLLNVRTPTERFTVGTKQTHSIYNNLGKVAMWDRLKVFVQKYASVGSTIHVYWLHQSKDHLTKVA